MLYAPQAGKTNRIRTKHPIYQDGRAVRTARPRKFTGASTNPQRGKLMWLTALRSQIPEAMSPAPWGITPSSR